MFRLTEINNLLLDKKITPDEGQTTVARIMRECPLFAHFDRYDVEPSNIHELD
jgi:hypothetical protein